MTNSSDDQPDQTKPAEGSTPPPPPPTSEPDKTLPLYGQTYGEQPNPYGGATFDQKPPAAPAASYGQPAAASYGTPPAASYGTPPPPPYGATPGYGANPAPYGAGMGRPDSGATTSMVLGIVGLVGGFLCTIGFLISPVAMFLGMSAKKRIDASAGALSGRGNAQAGFILGIIGTVFLVLMLLLVVVLVVVGISGGFDDSTYDPYESDF